MHRQSLIRTIAAAGSLLLCGGAPALAQAADPAMETAPAPFPDPYTPSWSDAEIQRVAEQLSGTWISDDEVGARDGSAGSRVVLTIAPIPVTGLSDTLFVEAATESALDKPFRFAIFQLIRGAGELRLRTLEIKTGPQSELMLAGFWAAPEWFPEVLDERFLIATSDLALDVSDDGFSGSSVHPYPTNIGGAFEMTSAIEVAGDRLHTTDTGIDASGGVAWGGSRISYTRTEPLAEVTRRDDGLVIIDFANPGEPVSDGDRLHIRYSGWRADTTLFDSNRDEGDPAFVFAYPPGTRLIVGWTPGTEGMSIGTKRKILIPWPLAYGERGNPRASIAPYAPLFFEMEAVHIDRYEPPAEPEDIAPAPQDNQPTND
ncbi:MAG: CpcT/CpeT family chromophore lyase [Phycisphaerales bacterium]